MSEQRRQSSEQTSQPGNSFLARVGRVACSILDSLTISNHALYGQFPPLQFNNGQITVDTTIDTSAAIQHPAQPFESPQVSQQIPPELVNITTDGGVLWRKAFDEVNDALLAGKVDTLLQEH